MYTRSISVLVITLLAGSIALGKSDPKEYEQGTVIDVSHDQGASGLVSDHRDSGKKYTYVIEGTEGRYEAREFQTDRLFKPLDVSPGGPVRFRVHPKGRILYVSLERGERPLEVLKFTRRGE